MLYDLFHLTENISIKFIHNLKHLDQNADDQLHIQLFKP